ncbi:MAG: molybdate ABC transporter substrate-binding protein [Hyphomicrobium sp.]
MKSRCILVASALWAAVAPHIAHAEQVEAKNLTVFAAASLKTALDEAASAYDKTAGVKTVISYAASSALAKQIEQGAPADVFISADLDWMDYVAKAKLIAGDTRANLLGNTLVLIAPKARPATLRIAPGFDLAGALGDGRLAVADVKAVPAGKYAKAAFEKLGVWAAVEPKLAQAENVRAALALVARGEAPFGVVYKTDAMAEPNVTVVDTFPANTHPHIVYPVAVTSTAKEPDAAKTFVAYLKGEAASAIFATQGFTILK